VRNEINEKMAVRPKILPPQDQPLLKPGLDSQENGLTFAETKDEVTLWT
jgi:hypothetical protein